MRGAQIDFAARYREAAADENVVAIDSLGMTGDANGRSSRTSAQSFAVLP
ncbi:MAG: hypothetical protein ACTHQM_20780 [Thermoanaerobaculia bacterium]